MSFSENWHAALDLQVGGPNKKPKEKEKMKMERTKEKHGNISKEKEQWKKQTAYDY